MLSGAAERTAHGAALAHRAGTVRALRTVATGTVATGTGGQLRCTTGQLGRATHPLLLRRNRLRTGYGGGHRSPRPLLLLLLLVGTLAQTLLLVLRGGTSGGGQLGAQVLVLPEQAGQFALDLVEEGIDLVLVIAFSEADGRELLVPHVLGGQRHLYFTST
ncbi:hypothetical protein SALB_03413 [Streptomyces noursei]|uniref:Uncharacterized protein n=1 Tax=Streptomyces noursei TaxID=1971 RepID=A0A401QZA9_STRNR|nr:hypothetical protein SALB_03413 [Streptomyces noursei]